MKGFKTSILFFAAILSAFALVITSCGWWDDDDGVTPPPAPVTSVNLPQTGQTTSYATGDDGNLQKGVAWPSPRFTIGTGAEADCVTDNLTGLMWVKSPDSITRTWSDALTYANGLISICGYDDWRLPNVNELESLVNAEQANTATWLTTQGFSNVQASFYWSSTTFASLTGYAWVVSMFSGLVVNYYKVNNYYVWPVRAGQ